MLKAVRRVAVVIGMLAVMQVTPSGAQEQEGEDDGSAVRYDVTSDVLTDPGDVVIDTGLLIENTEQNDTSTTSIIPDALVLYSATENLDVLAQISGTTAINQSLPDQNDPTGGSSADTRFGTLSVGGRYLFIEEGVYPALQGFLNLSVVENADQDTIFAQSGTVGLTLRKSVDPILIRSTLSYTRLAERRSGGVQFDPGDQYRSTTSVDFFVNETVALIGNITIEAFENDDVGGRSVERRRVRVPVGGGIRYSLRHNVLLQVEGEVDTVNESTRWSLSVQYLL